MAKAKYVTVGRKPTGKAKKQEIFRLPQEMAARIKDLVESNEFDSKTDVAEKAFEFYFKHLDSQKIAK
ncbi:hypothetical protein PDL04_26730 [Bacillus cereus group sp. BY142LC]|uniref:hypothetical protein n=1 Tax=Bacillus cereus group sp. BY142LC TaxID=3018083 RepID=UPI0022E56A38|nr:hypothetical protein [Bacillus cereus group sp. BY142LC]MDA1835047.1 hypothetical protein [Bacillus cereus group sp. BY142LC]